jgi:hypothetical protein
MAPYCNKDRVEVEYCNRPLTDEEKDKFIDSFLENVNQKLIMRTFFKHPWIALFFPLLNMYLIKLTITTCTNISLTIGMFLLGMLSLQLYFIFGHMWTHALMLYYNLWAVGTMVKIYGLIPTVCFYAFYHHHHDDDPEWMRKKLGHSKGLDGLATAFTHWESFSLFTQSYPCDHRIIKAFIFTSLYLLPPMIPFIAGWEFGTLLLPAAHDWVHEKKAAKFGLQYVFIFLEKIGIFASKQDHNSHHKTGLERVYQDFSSSGLYSKKLDQYLNGIWDHVYDTYGNIEYGISDGLKWYMESVLFVALWKSFIISCSYASICMGSMSCTMLFTMVSIIGMACGFFASK